MVDISHVGQRELLPLGRVVKGLSEAQGISQWQACAKIAEALMLEAAVQFVRPYRWEYGEANPAGDRPWFRSVEVARSGEAAVSTALLAAARDERWGAKLVALDAPDGRESVVSVDMVCVYRDEIEDLLRRKQLNTPPRWPELEPEQRRLSVKGETACYEELLLLMSTSRAPNRTRSDIEADMCNRHSISKRSFSRMWTAAVAAGGNANWSKPGRRRKTDRRIDTPE